MSDDPTARILSALERLVQGQAKLDSDVTRLRSDLMARMDRIQNAITAIRDDIAVNFGTADAVRRANDNTRDELRALVEQVNSMVRQINRLQTDVRTLKGEQ
jgi:flagellar hook-associated protein FlgK